MARTAKKEQNLTIDEKLDQALVPDVEQPYRIPANWRWAYIGKVSELYTGNSINEDVKQKKYYGQTEGLVYIATKDISFEGDIDYNTNVRIPEVSSFKVAPKNTALLCIEGGSAGRKIGFTNQPVCFVNKLCAFATEKMDSKYVYYFLKSHCFANQFEGKKHGLIGGVSVRELSNICIAVPPFTEQNRIVDRIESLFAKLDEAKEKAQTVVDGFEDRKAAILHKAFTGELTEKWRAICGLSLDGWENAPLEKVFQLRSGFTIEISDEKEFGSIPYVKVADMNLPDNKIQITTSSRFVDDCPDSRIIPNGSTIFPKRGGAILTNKKRYVGVEKIIADLNIMAIMPITEKAFGWYGYYWMQSIDLRKLNNGSNVPQINNKDMVKQSVPTPPIEEQIEIVRVLDGLFSKEQQAKEAAEQVIDQIDSMKKTILARAFRGELGTNDPNDEPAIELLKQTVDK